MKKIFLWICIFMLISCKKESEESFGKPTQTNAVVKTPEQLGQEIFVGKGNCVACHQIDQKVIGPSIQEIAKIYKSQNGSLIDFLKNDAKPLVDPSQYEVMKTNFAITKAMSDEELQAIEAYIYSCSK